MAENTTKRIRRTEIETSVFESIRELSKTKRLGQISFQDIANHAKIAPVVLKRNYTTIGSLLDKYAYSVDFCLHDLFDKDHPANEISKDLLITTLRSLAEALYDHSDMQQLLIWELVANNATIRRIARSREKYYKEAMEKYLSLFENSNIPMVIIASLFTAGIYYLILHRKRSTFWGVDYQNKENLKRLYDTLEFL